ncbi:hypothetical protein ACFSKN_05565 [Mariniflexile gromovii]|uniref:Uncharacterized protein n=1 Tax=Mariniflexile gromovii TaxID=362523 RepID=A0ABS4BTK5_9FLAO|nr:hypothetical protein [Mariniflexile gromovii]MBP0903914.1 hypothetical protein [Mariniflexile gromovii]
MKTMKLVLLVLFVSLQSCDKDDADPFVDLKAENTTYELVSKTTATTGIVRITGHIKNVGNTTYTSGSNQQLAQLLEHPLGTTTNNVVATSNISTSLNAGAEVSFSYTRNWDIAIEFQPEIILRISYDPDILIDGNSNNDDMDSSNNSFTLDGTAINYLF